MPADFDQNDSGLYRRLEDGRLEQLSEAPIEYVGYSALDHELYVRWPGKGAAQKMAALPMAVLEQPQRLRTWAENNALPLARGMERPVAEYLRNEAERRFRN